MSISITLFCARQHIRNLVSPLSFFIMHPSTCQRLHPFMCVCSSTPPSIYPVTLLFPRTSNSIYLSNIYSSVHQLTFDPTTFISTLYSPSSFSSYVKLHLFIKHLFIRASINIRSNHFYIHPLFTIFIFLVRQTPFIYQTSIHPCIN